jgi:hypothetical protein
MKRLLDNTDKVTITFGKHKNNLTGYWALVGKKHGLWHNTGHGHTLEDAIEEAISIYLGHQTKFIDQVKKVAGDSYQDELPTEYKAVFEAEYKNKPSNDEILYFLDCNTNSDCVVCAEQIFDLYFIWVYQL